MLLRRLCFIAATAHAFVLYLLACMRKAEADPNVMQWMYTQGYATIDVVINAPPTGGTLGPT